MVTVIEMAVVPGLAFKLGSLNGPVVMKMFDAKHLPLSDGGYVQVMLLPTLIMCGADSDSESTRPEAGGADSRSPTISPPAG